MRASHEKNKIYEASRVCGMELRNNKTWISIAGSLNQWANESCKIDYKHENWHEYSLGYAHSEYWWKHLLLFDMVAGSIRSYIHLASPSTTLKLEGGSIKFLKDNIKNTICAKLSTACNYFVSFVFITSPIWALVCDSIKCSIICDEHR